jgi:hypothetical protein
MNNKKITRKKRIGAREIMEGESWRIFGVED